MNFQAEWIGGKKRGVKRALSSKKGRAKRENKNIVRDHWKRGRGDWEWIGSIGGGGRT